MFISRNEISRDQKLREKRTGARDEREVYLIRQTINQKRGKRGTWVGPGVRHRFFRVHYHGLEASPCISERRLELCKGSSSLMKPDLEKERVAKL